MLASGRFTLRLIIDGTFSFAFVPLCELAAFAVVYRLQRGTRPFAQAVDRYFAGNTPWLWWFLALMAAAVILPVRSTDLLGLVLVTAAIPIALSVRIDWRLFRGDGRTQVGAASDVILQRAIAWTLATAYFLGIASSSRDFFYLFVEAKDAIGTFVGAMLG